MSGLLRRRLEISSVASAIGGVYDFSDSSFRPAFSKAPSR
jgi:hypothetical protein